MTRPTRRPSNSPMEATLHGGPSGGETIILGGLKQVNTWPDYVCVNVKGKYLAHHYRHIAAGVYEHQGPCVEFNHSPLPAVKRCPDCGSEIPTDRRHGHPDAG